MGFDAIREAAKCWVRETIHATMHFSSQTMSHPHRVHHENQYASKARFSPTISVHHTGNWVVGDSRRVDTTFRASRNDSEPEEDDDPRALQHDDGNGIDSARNRKRRSRYTILGQLICYSLMHHAFSSTELFIPLDEGRSTALVEGCAFIQTNQTILLRGNINAYRY